MTQDTKSRDRKGRALVTGASRGVGRATAVALARAGYDLVISGRDLDELQETSRQAATSSTQVESVAGDLRAHNVREEVFSASSSGLKVVVHCASATPDPIAQAELEKTSPDDIEELIDTTVKASTQLIHGLIPLLANSAPSNLIIVSSDWSLRGSHGPPVFSAAKAALSHLVWTSRRHLATRGISSTVIVPGDIASYDLDWTTAKWNLDDSVEAVRAELGETRIHLSDITDTVLFCLSRKLCRVEEINLAPLDHNYDY